MQPTGPRTAYLVFNTTLDTDTHAHQRLIAVPVHPENVRTLHRTGTLGGVSISPYVVDGTVNSTSRVIITRPAGADDLHLSNVHLMCSGTHVHGYGTMHDGRVFALDGLNLEHHDWTRKAINGEDRFPHLPDGATIVFVAVGNGTVRHVAVPLDHALAERLEDAPFGTSFIGNTDDAYLMNDTYRTHSERAGQAPLSEIIPTRPAEQHEPSQEQQGTRVTLDRVDLLLRNGYLHGYMTLHHDHQTTEDDTCVPYRLVGVATNNHPYLSSRNITSSDLSAAPQHRRPRPPCTNG